MATNPTEMQQCLVRHSSEVHFYRISVLPTVSELDRPRTNYVTLSCVRVTIAAAEKK